MKKKTKQRVLWFAFAPENDVYDDAVVISFTRKELRDRSRSLQAEGNHICDGIFERLMGFLPKAPTKITLTWEE